MKYTALDGRIFDLSTENFITSERLTSTDRPISIKNQKSSSCEWLKSHFNKSVTGKYCSQKICSAYVTCEKDGRRMTRFATCSVDLCSPGKANECSEQKGYGSVKVNFESLKQNDSEPKTKKQNKTVH